MINSLRSHTASPAGSGQNNSPTASWLLARVAFSGRGRTRLRFARGEVRDGLTLAVRLARYHDVTHTRWVQAAQSLIVIHDPNVAFSHLLSRGMSMPHNEGVVVVRKDPAFPAAIALICGLLGVWAFPISAVLPAGVKISVLRAETNFLALV